jgi:hypothetical protein
MVKFYINKGLTELIISEKSEFKYAEKEQDLFNFLKYQGMLFRTLLHSL